MTSPPAWSTPLDPDPAQVVAAAGSRREAAAPTHFTFAQIDEAYDVFKNAAANEALKVVITPG